MAELNPYPLEALLQRAFREIEAKDAIYDLPSRRFHIADPARDTSVSFHGRRASSPFGPAAGPHTQMAQNIVLGWLAGGRIFELKTVQARDRLQIPRPCIDVRNVGYNVEWSQELLLEQSLEEYVKGAMLVEILRASGRVGLGPDCGAVIYDMSVGYDLAGLRDERVQTFVAGMLDTRAVVDRLRRQIPSELRQFRDLEFPSRQAGSVTLSTFHGCPPGEIGAMADRMMREFGLDCTVKLNPTLLGRERLLELLHDELGYSELRVPEGAVEKDPSWEQAAGLVEQLAETSRDLGRRFAVKFTNTLVVENHLDVFPPGEKLMYLSGPPLHVLAMHLVRRFRREFGMRVPVSFSGGIDSVNFPDAVALGLVPVTVCTDLLKPGGYGRAKGYHRELGRRMESTGARHIGDFVLRSHGLGLAGLDALGLDPRGPERLRCEQALLDGGDLRIAAGSDELYERWTSAAAVLNTEAYVGPLAADPRYGREQNSKPLRKTAKPLELFDCLACDRCIPVCPNDANFRFVLPRREVPLFLAGSGHDVRDVQAAGVLRIERPHQIGNFADFCNDCGNCEAACPQHGRPYLVKPRFFRSLEQWRAAAPRDGFFLAGTCEAGQIWGRIDGQEHRLEVDGRRATLEGPHLAVSFDADDPLGTLVGAGVAEDAPIPLRNYHILRWLLEAVLDPAEVNAVNSL